MHVCVCVDACIFAEFMCCVDVPLDGPTSLFGSSLRGGAAPCVAGSSAVIDQQSAAASLQVSAGVFTQMTPQTNEVRYSRRNFGSLYLSHTHTHTHF